MKKAIKFILTLITINTIIAQNVPEKSFGIKIGGNISKLVGEKINNATAQYKFHLGGFYNMPLTDKISIQPELLFSTQGVNQSLTNDYSKFENTINLYYLNFPFIFQYHLIPKLNLEAGLQIGFLLKAKEETTYRNIPAKIVEKDKTNIYNLLAPVDFGLNIGSSYYITNEFFVAIKDTM